MYFGQHVVAGALFSFAVIYTAAKIMKSQSTSQTVEKIMLGIVVILASAFLLALSFAWIIHTKLQAGTNSPSTAAPPAPPPVSIYLGCEWDHIPIRIPAASTIHVIRMHPGVLVSGYGAFENVSSPYDKAISWPSDRDGRWMTKKEAQAVISRGHIPTPYAFNCTIKNFSSVTLEMIELVLIVQTEINKSHAVPIYFNPLTANDSFTFYLVNICSSGEVPIDAQWSPQARLRVLGETKPRVVAINFEKTNFPNELMMFGGASAFLWNGMSNCQWK